MRALWVLALLLGAAAGMAEELRERCLMRLAPFGVAEGEPTRHFGRGRPYDVRHILLDLEVDLPGERLSGTATHTLQVIGEPSRLIVFDSVGLDIAQVLLNGSTPLEFEVTEDELKMHLAEPMPAGQDFQLSIQYQVQRPKAGMYFRTERMGYTPEELQAWTQGEAEDARYWFPCFDAPNERATTEVFATVAEGLSALSNGNLLEISAAAGGKQRFHWRLDEPHVTCLVNLVVGRFSEIKEEGGGVPLYYYVRPELESTVPFAFGRTPQMMEFFQNILKTPYPYTRYSQVAVVDFIAGGMENTTLSTMMERTLHDEAAHQTYSSDWLVAHELAHQWFGDLVTCRDWSHIWLNEGFASYFELLFEQHHKGEDTFRHWLFDNQDQVLGADVGEMRAPIVRNVYAGPGQVFDVRVYEKGACVLHMLRKKVGDDFFWQALKEYLARYKNQSVETTDLLRTFEEITGQGLEQFFHQWVYSGGYPELKATYEWLDAEGVAKVSVSQTQVVDDRTPMFRLETELLFQLPDGTHREPVLIDRKEQVFHVKLAQRPTFVRLDPERDLLMKLDFSRPKDMLVEQLDKDASIAGQYEACDALAQYADDGVVDALVRRLEHAEFWGVRARAAKALGQIDHTKAVEALVRAAAQPEARVRQAVAGVLGTLRKSEATDALRTLTQDPAPYVASAAIAALADQGAADAVASIKQTLSRDSHNETVRSAALHALATLEHERSVPTLTKYVEHEKRAVRRSAILALAEAGKWMENKNSVRQRLEAQLDSSNAVMRRVAVEALATLGDLRAVDALERHGRTVIPKDEQERVQAALKALQEQQSQTSEVKDLRDKVQQLEEQGQKLEKALEELRGLVEAR